MKKLPERPQLEMFEMVLTSFIHPEHELCLLVRKIEWNSLQNEFEPFYGTTGLPSGSDTDHCRVAVAQANLQPGG